MDSAEDSIRGGANKKPFIELPIAHQKQRGRQNHNEASRDEERVLTAVLSTLLLESEREIDFSVRPDMHLLH